MWDRGFNSLVDWCKPELFIDKKDDKGKEDAEKDANHGKNLASTTLDWAAVIYLRAHMWTSSCCKSTPQGTPWPGQEG